MKANFIILSIACFGTLVPSTFSMPAVMDTIMGASGDMSAVVADGSSNQISTITKGSSNVLSITANGSAQGGQEALSTGGSVLRSAVSTAGSLGGVLARTLAMIMGGSISSLSNSGYVADEDTIVERFVEVPVELQRGTNTIEVDVPAVEVVAPIRPRLPVTEEVVYEYINSPRRYPVGQVYETIQFV